MSEPADDSRIDESALPSKQPMNVSLSVVNNFGYEQFFTPGVDGDAYKAWNDWFQGLEHIFEASNTPEGKKFSTMLSYGGKELRNIYSAINNGKIPKTEDFKTAIEKLEQYFKPKQHGTYLRVKFWETVKADNETIDEFVSRLQEKKRHCDFGSTKEEIEDFVMTDKFLTSMPQYIKQELIKDKKLNFESAVRQAKEMESSRNQARELSQPVKDKPFLGGINRLQDRWVQERRPYDPRYNDRRFQDRRFQNRRSQDQECFRCKSTMHRANSDECPAREAKCYECGNKGHFANSVFCMEQEMRGSSQRNEKEPNIKKQKIVVRNVDDDEEIYL